MSEQINQAIFNLLYQQDQLSLVGLGSFVTQPKATTIDPVQGQIRPPAREVIFDSSRTINDGILIAELQKQGLSAEEAEAQLQAFIKDVQETLDKKEIVSFPKVGRLYRDYENNLKFLPEATNFARDAYGLPDIQFYPVIRSKQEQPPSILKTATTTSSKTDVSGSISDWFQRRLPLIVLLTAIVIAMGLFLLIRGQRAALERQRAAQTELPDDRINVAPSAAEAEQDISDDIQQQLQDEPEDVLDADDDLPTAAGEDINDSEAPTIAPDVKTGIITIGLFGNPDNVNKLVQRLYEAGYEPYTEERGRLTLVGVQFPYSTSEELDQMLNDVRNEFESKARIYEL